MLREWRVNAECVRLVREILYITFFREARDLHRYHLSTRYIIPAPALPAGIR